MSGYILGADAELDLDHAWNTSPRDNIDAADRWIGKLFDAFESPVLFWSVGAYYVIYRAERRPVEIVAVTQGSRDIPAFLHRRMH